MPLGRRGRSTCASGSFVTGVSIFESVVAISAVVTVALLTPMRAFTILLFTAVRIVNTVLARSSSTVLIPLVPPLRTCSRFLFATGFSARVPTRASMALVAIVSAFVRISLLVPLSHLAILVIRTDPPPLQAAVFLVVPIILCIAPKATKSGPCLFPLLGSKRSIMAVCFSDNVFQKPRIRFRCVCCRPRSFRMRDLSMLSSCAYLFGSKALRPYDEYLAVLAFASFARSSAT